MAGGESRCLEPRVHAEFVEHALDVCARGAVSHPHGAGDLAGALTPGESGQHFSFTCGRKLASDCSDE